MRPQQTAPPQPTLDASPPGATPSDLVGPFELTLAAAHDAPAATRAAVSAWMAGHVSDTMLADAQLLAVELVANSVRHADAPADAVVTYVLTSGPTSCIWRSRIAAAPDRSRDARRICNTAAALA